MTLSLDPPCDIVVCWFVRSDTYTTVLWAHSRATCLLDSLLQACREALRKENLKVQWQQSNKRWVATFYVPRDDEALHVVPGDELVLQHETGVIHVLSHNSTKMGCSC